jgi:riboflavin synthase
MFTGIIETIGTIVSVGHLHGDIRLRVSAPEFADQDIALGDSIACNGVCLTVIERNEHELAFDVSIESINRSLIGEWQTGTKVNLEMALLPTTRLGGHMVSGHVDGLAQLDEVVADARSSRMVFSISADLKKYVAKKGSITINGVSLTVNSVQDNVFDINVIPHTLKVTTLGELKVSDQVHIEVDLIARYLERLLTGEQAGDDNLAQALANTRSIT